MRTIVSWAVMPVVLVAMACQDKQPTDDLKNDLALIGAPAIELAPAGGTGATFVSAVEKLPTPAPALTPTPTRKRARKAPPPQEVQVEATSTEETATAPEIVTVAPSETPVAVEAPAPESAPAVRPQPIEPRYPVGGGTVYGTGRDRGTGGGGVGVVIRGGRTGRDPCDIHDRGGRPGIGILINNRFPGTPTFPRR